MDQPYPGLVSLGKCKTAPLSQRLRLGPNKRYWSKYCLSLLPLPFFALSFARQRKKKQNTKARSGWKMQSGDPLSIFHWLTLQHGGIASWTNPFYGFSNTWDGTLINHAGSISWVTRYKPQQPKTDKNRYCDIASHLHPNVLARDITVYLTIYTLSYAVHL